MRRITIPALLTLAALAATASVGTAAENLPKGSFQATEEIYDRLGEYSKLSRKLLGKLDVLMSQEKIGDSKWRSIGREGGRAAQRMKRDVEGLYKDAGIRVPKSVAKWMDHEWKAWQNVKKIGSGLISLHDGLLFDMAVVNKAINEVDELTEKYKKELAEFDDLLKRYNAYEEMMRGAGSPTAFLKFGARKAQELYRDLSGATPTLKAKVKILFKENEEVTERRKAWDPDKFLSEVKAIIKKKLDPDQKGVFFKHEKHWEKQIEALAKQYESLFDEYDEASEWIKNIKDTPIFPSGGGLLLPVAEDYLKGIADKVKEGIEDFG